MLTQRQLDRALADACAPVDVPADHLEASVLVPVVLAREPFVLLTRRSASLRRHPEQAALREAHEEIGLDPVACTTVGQLPPVLTTMGFHVIPVLACVRPDAVRRAWLGGAWRECWVWQHSEHRIWGAIAAILASLASTLRAASKARLADDTPHTAKGEPLETTH